MVFDARVGTALLSVGQQWNKDCLFQRLPWRELELEKLGYWNLRRFRLLEFHWPRKINYEYPVEPLNSDTFGTKKVS